MRLSVLTFPKTCQNLQLQTALPYSLPLYLFEDRPETSSLLRMDVLDEAYPALQMLAEMGMTLAVLGFRALAGAVGEDRLQQIEIGSPHIEVLVCHQPCEMLTHRWPHDARLAVLDGKIFLHQDHCDKCAKAFRRTVEGVTAGESEVVRISGVDGPAGLSEPAQTAVQAVAAEIRERRGCRRTLRQVGPRIHVAD